MRRARPRAQVMLPEGPGTYSIRDLGITMYAPRGHAEYNMRSFEARPRPRGDPSPRRLNAAMWRSAFIRRLSDSDPVRVCCRRGAASACRPGPRGR